MHTGIGVSSSTAFAWPAAPIATAPKRLLAKPPTLCGASVPAGSKVAAVEAALKSQYGSNKHAIFGTLNKIGLMRGSKVTKKGRQKSKPGKRRASMAAQTMNMLGVGRGM